ncbi:unnamed protein product [Diamesa serratosioi]
MVVASEARAIPLMEGTYTYVGLDVDSTGRRLIDEIVHIAAYTPNDDFSQHVMPLMNLNPAARQRHQIRVITVGFFRMMKSMQTYKVIKTKTEIATLNEFLTWLEKINTNDGVIFVYHDQRKFIPYILIEAFKKYNLMDRLMKTVKSFVNGYDLAEEKTANTIKYLTLSQISKILLDKEKEMKEDKECSEHSGAEEKDQPTLMIDEKNENGNSEMFEGNASIRAKLTYEICEHLARGCDKEEMSEEEVIENFNEFIRSKAKPVEDELNELDEQEENLVRQNSLRSVFLQYFRSTLYHRVKAVTYRRLLAEAKHNNDTLEQLWNDGKRDAIAETVNKIESLKEEERTELIEILDCHYDPEKKSIKPITKQSTKPQQSQQQQQQPRRRMPRNRNMNKENRNRGGRQRNKSNDSNKKFYSNNNNSSQVSNNNNSHTHNNNMITSSDTMKSGGVRKDYTQVDSNQNIITAST